MAKGGDICTNSLSLVMMQNQNQVQSQYSSTVRSGTSVGGRRGGRGSVDAQLYGEQRGKERGVGTGEYERRTFRGKSKRSVRNKGKGMDEEEADEYRLEEDEEEDEDERLIEAADEKDVIGQRIIKSKQKKFRKLSRIFALSESVFSILCVGAWETDIGSSVGSSSKKIIVNKRERAAARNAEGTCLRTFVLPFALSDVAEGCLLVGGKEKDAFAATTGERSRC